MKISKLFHWLYALVMLLPIFAIGVTCGYAMFNKNAYQSYASETINKCEYENISITNLEVGKEYYLITPNTNTYTRQEESTEISVSSLYLDDIFKDVTKIRLYVPNNSNLLYIQAIGNEGFTYTSIQGHIIKFEYLAINNSYYATEIESILYKKQYFEFTYISEVFYYSVDKVTQSNLFNWAYDSFLVTPFAYIVSLFSMPSSSPVVMLLSYWLAISIIWLVFDLVMYVPLLVHRWLDKGVIE